MGADSVHPPLELLPPQEISSYQHVVLMVMDGFGWDFLQRGLPQMDLPPETEIHCIESVFPATTAAAMTTLYTGMSPAEHGYLGWTLPTEENQPYISILPGNIMGKTQDREALMKCTYDKMPLTSVFSRIQQQGDGRECFLVQPRSFKTSQYTQLTSAGAHIVPYQRERDFARALYSPVKKHQNEKTFTFAYNEDPDKKTHLSGTNRPWARDFYRHFGHLLCKLASRYRDSSTLLLVTADHGLTDMDRYLALNEDEAFMNLLEKPPFPEARFLSFFVKPGCHQEFRSRFLELTQGQFILLTREEFLDKGFLGPGSPAPVLKELLGDFLAIGTGRLGLKYFGSEKSRKKKPGCYKAHHAGLSELEMQVPLLKLSFQPNP